ncbi:hypothetical protein [Staphylococcus schweitzeri]|uniref:hypothetical protein n=2 Tax=Staphylococcus schweitzeri TaxID=1654388 RepID=UPI0004FF8CD8|nr:hypothetical protein [Staphylococcus schweitzeri]CDR61972.1 hypothetical protein ERS140239_01815 [Staphylococcus schweitzeri]
MTNIEKKIYHSSIVLNTELYTAGEFLFDGLNKLINVSNYQSNSEPKIFMAYYLISVGIERLQKVILTLSYNYIENEDYKIYSKKVKKALYSHNHENLNNMIREYTKIDYKFSKDDNKLISKLMDFYNNERYSKFDSKTAHDTIYQFHTGHQFKPFKQDLSFYEILERIFSSIERILTTYFDLLEKLQENMNNYIGECSSDTKIFVLKNYSRNLKKYFTLFKYAKYEFNNTKFGNGGKTPFLLDGHTQLSEIDSFFDGNGQFLVDWLIQVYLTKYYSHDDEIIPFYNEDEGFKENNKITDEIIEYYSNRYEEFRGI